MLTKTIASSLLIVSVLLIRGFFQKRVSPVLVYAVWMVVALRLLLPGAVLVSPVSIMNTKIWNEGKRLITEEYERQDREHKEQIYQEYYNRLMEETAKQRVKTETSVTYSGSIAKTSAGIDEALKADIGVWESSEKEEMTTVEILPPEKVEIKWHLASTPFDAAGQIAALIWAVGMAAFTLIFLWKNLSFYKYLCSVRRELQKVEAGKRKIPVYWADERLASPCLFGLVPAIYIPKESIPVQGEQINFILEHELMHYRHRDHIWAFVRILCLIINWYNPLVWLAAKLSVRDGELACDAGCICRLGEDKRCAYGEALIAMIKPVRGREELLGYATMMTSGKKFMKKRIENIADKRKNSIFSAVALAGLVFFCAGCTFTGTKQEEAEHAGTQSQTAMTNEESVSKNQDNTEEKEDVQYDGRVILLKDGRNSENLYGSLAEKIIILTSFPNDEKNETKILTVLNEDMYLPDLEGNYIKLGEICHQYEDAQILEILNRDMDLHLSGIDIWDYDFFIQAVDEAGGLTIDVKDRELEGINNYQLMMTGNELLENKVTESGSQTLNGIQTAAYLQIKYEIPGGYYEWVGRWKEVSSQLLEKKGIPIYDEVSTDAFAGPDRSIYVEEEGKSYMLCFEWEKAVRELHSSLYPESDYEPTDYVLFLDGGTKQGSNINSMKEKLEEIIADSRDDVIKVWNLFSIYMGENPYMISLLAGKEMEQETEDAWNTVSVFLSGSEVEINEEKGRAVFDMKLAFEENGVIELPEYTDKQYVTVQRYLYLKKINDEWYVDGPLHNELPPEKWWNGDEIEWQSYDFGFSDENSVPSE